MSKTDLYNNSNYKSFMKSIEEFEKSDYGNHYKNLLCLKETSGKTREKTKTYLLFHKIVFFKHSFKEM
jgi:hypothetical protein